MAIIDAVQAAWGWAGLAPAYIVHENEFGNLLIKDAQGAYWRLSPEDCYCQVVAQNQHELDELLNDAAFLQDWNMSALVAAARAKHGALADGQKYCLLVPGFLGGEYEAENIGTAPLETLVLQSGDIARQVRDLPDGGEIVLAQQA